MFAETLRGMPMTTYPDGTLLKGSGPEIDMMAGGVRRWIPDPATFNDMGPDWGKVVVIPDSEFSASPSGRPYPSRVMSESFTYTR
jgi:hypothetical protein